MEFWESNRPPAVAPSQEQLREVLQRTGFHRLKLDETAQTVRFMQPGMRVNVSNMAKGFALDRSSRIARLHGVERGLIDLGGNVCCLGQPPPGKAAYSIGIRNPFAPDTLIGTVEVLDAAVATIGNYEKLLERDGERICDRINPKTGYPVAEARGVTVITRRSVDSDVFATAVFIAGESMARKLVSEYPGTRILLTRIDEKGRPLLREYSWRWQQRLDATAR